MIDAGGPADKNDSPSLYPVFAHVCLEQVPPADLAAKEKEFGAHGWVWVEHKDLRRIVLMRKVFADPVSERAVEEEIRDVMGERYVGLAAPGSPKALGDEPRVEGPSDRVAQLVDEGWELTELRERTDADGNIHGGGQLARPKADPHREG
jgi:hypothetical protein